MFDILSCKAYYQQETRTHTEENSLSFSGLRVPQTLLSRAGLAVWANDMCSLSHCGISLSARSKCTKHPGDTSFFSGANDFLSALPNVEIGHCPCKLAFLL